MWIVDILPLHDTIARLPLHEEGTRFIIVVHRTKRDYYTDVDVIILFVSSWQQSTTISFCISCFSSFGFSFTTARSWKKVIVIVEGWQFVRLVVLILETRLGTNTTYCSPDYAQNVATN